MKRTTSCLAVVAGSLATTFVLAGCGAAPSPAARAPSGAADGASYAAAEAPDSAEGSSEAPKEASSAHEESGEPGAAPVAAAPPPPRPAAPGGGYAPLGGAGAARAASTSAPAPAAKAEAVAFAPAVRAGEWDDNANYRELMRYLGSQSHLGFHRIDVRDRQFLVVRDIEGRAVPGCPVTVRDEQGRSVTLKTMSSGRALLFPHAEGLRGDRVFATATCAGGGTARAALSLGQSDGVVDLRLSTQRALPAARRVDIAFILDTTGSMGEEIAATKATVQKVARALEGTSAKVRIGLVEFRDRTDPFVTRVYPMTDDLPAFATTVSRLSAGGGGDTPESVNEGVHVAIHRLDWDESAVARFAFLIGDAPPHLDYQKDADYAEDAREAAHRGIQMHTIAASGMDDLGQVVWRQIAQYTGGTNMFVLRGGAGPQSTGAGDPKSSCGGTQKSYSSGALDALILGKVVGALKAIDRDPMRIAGLGKDENAKPCAERIVATD